MSVFETPPRSLIIKSSISSHSFKGMHSRSGRIKLDSLKWNITRNISENENPSNPEAQYLTHWFLKTHMCIVHQSQWTGLSLVQVMACCLFGAKPLPQPTKTYWQLNSFGKKTDTCEIKCAQIFFQANAFENVCNISAIFFWGQFQQQFFSSYFKFHRNFVLVQIHCTVSYCYKILHMSWQCSCHAVCKIS